MDSPGPSKQVKIRRWLPYYAVFLVDSKQTLHSWIFRAWVAVSVLTASGYLLYRMAIDHEAGIVQHASTLISDLLRWCVMGSMTLIVVLTAGSISSERGTMADSVLSRGISRYQYFLGKWHARLATVLGAFLVMGLTTVAGSYLLLHDDLSLRGSLVGLLLVGTLLATVISGGVTVSAIFNSTLLGIVVLLIILYGTGMALSLLPAHYPSPYHAINSLPAIVRGDYDLSALGRLAGWSLLVSVGMAVFGMGYFSRRDV